MRDSEPTWLEWFVFVAALSYRRKEEQRLWMITRANGGKPHPPEVQLRREENSRNWNGLYKHMRCPSFTKFLGLTA